MIAFGILIVITVIFATSSSYEPRQRYGRNDQSEQNTASKIEHNGFIGIGPDGWTAIFTGFLTVFTSLLVGTSYVQIRYLVRADETARKSAEAAISAPNVAKDALIFNNRPWIRASVEIGTQPLILSHERIYGSIKILIENVGNAPSFNVMIHTWLLIWRTDKDLFQEHARLCEEARKSPINISFSLFPGEKFPNVNGYNLWQESISVNKEDIDAGIAAGLKNENEDIFVSLFVGGMYLL